MLACVGLAAQARTRSHYGGTLRIETTGDAWQRPDGLAWRLVLDTLTTSGDQGAAQAALAVKWESQNEAQRWDFTLRTGVRFQDGTPLTADAVVASLEQSCPAGAPVACPWSQVHAVGQDVVFVADAPEPDLPELLAQTQFAIARQDATGTIEGTGPFRVAGFSNGVLTLTANDDCWQGRPFLDSVEIVPHRAVRDQWLDLSVGRADVVEVPPDLVREAEQQHMNVLVSGPVDLLALTIQPTGELADLGMRQAMALAVDRAALSNVIYQRQGEITGSLLPERLSGYAFLFPVGRDLERARALRGGATPPPLALSVNEGSPAMQLAAQRLALNLHEAGFVVQPAYPDSGQAAPLRLRRVHLQATSARAALDEMLAQFGQNGTVTGTDAGSLYRAERAALAEGTVVPLLWLPRAWAVGDRVRDLRLSPDGMPQVAGASLEGVP